VHPGEASTGRWSEGVEDTKRCESGAGEADLDVVLARFARQEHFGGEQAQLSSWRQSSTDRRRFDADSQFATLNTTVAFGGRPPSPGDQPRPPCPGGLLRSRQWWGAPDCGHLRSKQNED